MNTEKRLIEEFYATLCEALEALGRSDTATVQTMLKGARDDAAEYIEQAERNENARPPTHD